MPSTSPDAPSEFLALLEPLLDRAYSYALHLTREPADAEDLVQEAALLSLRHFAQFTPGTNFRAWFFRILTNRHYATFKQRRRMITVADDAALDHVVADGHRDTVTPTDPIGAMSTRDDLARIHAAVAELPDEFRAVCAMFLVDDCSYAEIAAVLEIPVGTVRSRLHRGRRILRRRLADLASACGLTIAPPSTLSQPRHDRATHV